MRCSNSGVDLFADDDRLDGVRVLGLDEHDFFRGSFDSPASWMTGFVDVETGRLLETSSRIAPQRPYAAGSAHTPVPGVTPWHCMLDEARRRTQQ